MFPNDTKAGKHTLVFIAGFHLGIPLAICQTPKSIGWAEISKELSESFSNHSTRFDVVSANYEPETKFPLGKPIIIRHLNFFDMFNLPEFLQQEGFSFSTDRYKLDNMIWICPSGAILVMGKISFDINDSINLFQFENNIVENHYAELAYIFTEVAEVIINIFPMELLSSSLCCSSDVEKCKKGIDLRKKSPSTRIAYMSLLQDNQVRALYDDILIDVYYIDFFIHENEGKIRVGYVDSLIQSSDPSYLFIISIAYSSFVGLLWLQKHLGEQSVILQQALTGMSPLREKTSSELKLFRIFCLQFINESSPISIRLTRKYMECLEDCWKQYRMHKLVDQVNSQLVTLEKMFEWIEEVRKEIRNYKIGLAAVLLAIISITAVSAQLVSTIDVNSLLGVNERIFLILIGFIIGILSTIVIYMLPISKLYIRLGVMKRKRPKKKPM